MNYFQDYYSGALVHAATAAMGPVAYYNNVRRQGLRNTYGNAAVGATGALGTATSWAAQKGYTEIKNRYGELISKRYEEKLQPSISC